MPPIVSEDVMDVEPSPADGTQAAAESALHDADVLEKDLDDDEDIEDLLDMMDNAKVESNDAVALLTDVLKSPKDGPKAVSLKERAVYDITRAYCGKKEYDAIVKLLEESTFFGMVTKAKCAKIVRQVLDIVCTLAPTAYDQQQALCNQIIAWCTKEKRTFLRQRVEAKLAGVLFAKSLYADALALIDRLLTELKKLDDKQLLVETHLMESKIHFALRNVPKAKAALTASRTCANAIYVAPTLQASMDTMSGTIHTEESDYTTAHSYFLEAFEQLDQMNEPDQATPCLKYMMLCRILESLTKALARSATKDLKSSAKGKNNSGNITSTAAPSSIAPLDVTSLISARQAVKYAGRDLDAMAAIAKAASRRSLHEYVQVLKDYSSELQDDLLIKHHLHLLQEQLLESNLIRLLEPYSCVQLTHLSSLMELPLVVVEKKLSQMILDGKFAGILNQGEGQLIVYDDDDEAADAKESAMAVGLEVLEHMDEVVTTLFARSNALRTLMM